MTVFKSLKNIVLAEFFKAKLLENLSQLRQVELFVQKLEPNLSQTKSSLGSETTLEILIA